LLQAISKLALQAQTVEIACLPLRQDLGAKNLLTTAQRNFRLSNSLLSPSIIVHLDLLGIFNPAL